MRLALAKQPLFYVQNLRKRTRRLRARCVKARWIPAPRQVPGRLRAGMKGGAPSPRRSREVDGVVDGYAVLSRVRKKSFVS